MNRQQEALAKLNEKSQIRTRMAITVPRERYTNAPAQDKKPKFTLPRCICCGAQAHEVSHD